MEETGKFAANVIIIDVAHLDELACKFKTKLGIAFNQEIENIDLSILITYFAIDGGMSTGDNSTDVLFIYDAQHAQFNCCNPASLPNELNDVAFRNEIGEFCFHSFSTEGIVALDYMFLDSLQVLCNANEVKRLIVFGNEEIQPEIEKILSGSKGKKVTNFCMKKPQKKQTFKSIPNAHPLMKSLGFDLKDTKQN